MGGFAFSLEELAVALTGALMLCYLAIGLVVYRMRGLAIGSLVDKG